MQSLKTTQDYISFLEQFQKSLNSFSREKSARSPLVVSEKQIYEVMEALNQISETYGVKKDKDRAEQESVSRLISVVLELKKAAEQEQSQRILGAIQPSFFDTINRVESVLKYLEHKSKKVREVENDPLGK
jgi:hypothetical protein